jgi:imidazolonepropionase-like amidohydrolase
MRTLFLVVLLPPLALLQALQPPLVSEATLALTGGTVIDVTNGRVITNATILIRGDRFVRLGWRDVQIPPDARIERVDGRWILPGLIDMHVHVSTVRGVPLGLYVANGVTAVRDLGGSLTVLRSMRDALEKPTAALRPRLFFAGAILDGNPPAAPRISFIVDTPERAASAVDFLVDQTADVVKVYNGVSATALKAIATAARARGVPVVGHVPRALTVRQAVELGMIGIEHAALGTRDLEEWNILTRAEADRIDSLRSVTERETNVWSRVNVNAQDIRALVAELATKEVVLDPTLSVDEYDTLFLYDAEAQHPNNRYLSRDFVTANLGPEHDIFRVPAAMRTEAVAGLTKRKEFVGLSYRAGVPIVAGTDGPGIGTLAAGFGLHRELELLVEAGLTPLDALRAATINAARALRREGVLGTVEAGKYADLVVLTANPLQNIRNAATIGAVLTRGQYFRRATLDKLLDDWERERARHH